jgi:Tryptophan 2,3-dioxygenase (vermilion)
VQFRAIEAMSGLRDPHFMQVLEEHGEIDPLIRAALDRPSLQEQFNRVLTNHSVTVEQIYTEEHQRPLQMLAESLSSTSKDLRCGGSCTFSSSRGSSGPTRAERAGLSGRSTCRELCPRDSFRTFGRFGLNSSRAKRKMSEMRGPESRYQ